MSVIAHTRRHARWHRHRGSGTGVASSVVSGVAGSRRGSRAAGHLVVGAQRHQGRARAGRCRDRLRHGPEPRQHLVLDRPTGGSPRWRRCSRSRSCARPPCRRWPAATSACWRGSAFGYLPLSVLGVSLAAPLTMLLLAATDQMSAVVSASAATGGARFLDHAAQVAGALAVSGRLPVLRGRRGPAGRDGGAGAGGRAADSRGRRLRGRADAAARVRRDRLARAARVGRAHGRAARVAGALEVRDRRGPVAGRSGVCRRHSGDWRAARRDVTDPALDLRAVGADADPAVHRARRRGRGDHATASCPTRMAMPRAAAGMSAAPSELAMQLPARLRDQARRVYAADARRGRTSTDSGTPATQSGGGASPEPEHGRQR